MNGAVVADPRTEGLPRHDRVWNSPRVFHAAKEWQRVTGRFTTLSNRELRADVAHWTFPVPVRLEGAANIYCVHDVIPLRLPATSSAHKGMFLRMLQTIGREADLIVTVSEAARRDILDILDIDENRVVNTYQCLPNPEPGPGRRRCGTRRPARRGVRAGAWTLRADVRRVRAAEEL